jgi:hypothetical protein
MIVCAQCQKETPRNQVTISFSQLNEIFNTVFQVMLDRGFKNDMQSLPIICSLCNWTGLLENYQVISFYLISSLHFLFLSFKGAS